MTIRGFRFKRSDGQIVIVQGVRQRSLAAYIKATEWSLTMSGSTGEVVLRVSQLGLLVGTKIGLGNLNVLK